MAKEVDNSVLWQSEHLLNDDKEKKQQHSEKAGEPDPMAFGTLCPGVVRNFHEFGDDLIGEDWFGKLKLH